MEVVRVCRDVDAQQSLTEHRRTVLQLLAAVRGRATATRNETLGMGILVRCIPCDCACVQTVWARRRCDVKYRELMTSSEIAVRAWDSRKNGQPEHVTWVHSQLRLSIGGD